MSKSDTQPGQGLGYTASRQLALGLGESSGSLYDYIAQGGCVCGGEAESELVQAPAQDIVFSGGFGLYAGGSGLRRVVKRTIREYTAAGGAICGGAAEVAIGAEPFTNEELTMMLMMAATYEAEYA